ncbi:MAG: hypothetical protein DPW11_00405 [bacterium]|nr:hypothetical protein [Candidatus Microgenomates bacterium CPR3]MCQ3944229.1 hypothetical protein [bacterium]RIK51751.1 MAG: hypothetical protein DCC61_01585 [Candidatus Microgenomates bacterium]
MTRSQKIFLAVLSLYVVFDFTLGSLVGLYLWETTKEASRIISYYIFLFLSILITTQLTSGLINGHGAKKVYISSILLGLIQALVLMIVGSSIGNVIIPFGILAGTSIGLQAMSYSLIVSFVTSNKDTTKFLAIKSSLMNVISIISVPIITSLISLFGSYHISYVISFFAGLAIIVLISKISIPPSSEQSSSLGYRSLMQIDEVRIFAITRLLYGVYNGPMWAILGIVTYIFIGDVARWGYISTSLTILSIIGAYFYSRISSSSVRNAVSTITTFLFASIALLLATNWSFVIFMLYQIVVVLLNSSFSLHYEGVIYSLVNENETIRVNISTVLAIGEIAMGLGRIVPLALLLIVGFTFENPTFLQILFILISVIPILILNKLSSIIPHSSRYATIHS